MIADGRKMGVESSVKTLPAILVIGKDGTVIKRQWRLAKSDIDGITRFINRYLAEQSG